MMIKHMREPVNGLIHLAGVILALVALGFLVGVASAQGKIHHLLAFLVFGLSLVALYTASALYHLLPLSERGIEHLRRLDHIMIFFLIAGTYTPFGLIALYGGWRWGVLGTVWGLALAGVVMKCFWLNAPVWFSTLLYLIQGWVAVAAVPVLLKVLPAGAFVWLLLGGLVYSVGAVIFATDRPVIRRGVFEAHELWHVMVLIGSACHVWAIGHYLTPFA